MIRGYILSGTVLWHFFLVSPILVVLLIFT